MYKGVEIAIQKKNSTAVALRTYFQSARQTEREIPRECVVKSKAKKEGKLNDSQQKEGKSASKSVSMNGTGRGGQSLLSG